MLPNACPSLISNRLSDAGNHEATVHLLLLTNTDRTIPRGHQSKHGDKRGQRLHRMPRIGHEGIAGQSGDPHDPVLVVVA